MKWRDRAARALDLTHEAEQHKLGWTETLSCLIAQYDCM
jgi:hypothetical protein